MKDLGTLGGAWSTATAISANGQVAGYAQTNGASGGNYDAFLDSNGTMTDLGRLSSNGNSFAYGINDSGQVVGSANNGATAFLYSNGAMTDLNSLIAPSSGWYLQQANAINDAGQIVGFGTHGGTHAFLLTPIPERSTLVLLGIGAVNLFAYVWRRRAP